LSSKGQTDVQFRSAARESSVDALQSAAVSGIRDDLIAPLTTRGGGDAQARIPCAAFASELELDVANAVLVRIGFHFKSEPPAHVQHHGVFLKHVSRDHLEPF
jgi:hypothetical protein